MKRPIHGFMKRSVSTLALAVFAAVTTLAACDRAQNKSADTSLNTDLSLAAQQRGFRPLDSLAPAERAAGNAAFSGAPVAAAPRTTHRVSSSGDVARPRRSS